DAVGADVVAGAGGRRPGTGARPADARRDARIGILAGAAFVQGCRREARTRAGGANGCRGADRPGSWTRGEVRPAAQPALARRCPRAGVQVLARRPVRRVVTTWIARVETHRAEQGAGVALAVFLEVGGQGQQLSPGSIAGLEHREVAA